MRPARCILAAALACATPLAIEAHHGAAQFDPAKVITLKGTTVALHFTNPHAMINFEVKSPQGESVVWIGELQAPNILKRGGWNKFTLKPGDAVMDFSPGGGYFTRIFSKIVGTKGRVYAFAPLTGPAPWSQAAIGAAKAQGRTPRNPIAGALAIQHIKDYENVTALLGGVSGYEIGRAHV